MVPRLATGAVGPARESPTRHGPLDPSSMARKLIPESQRRSQRLPEGSFIFLSSWTQKETLVSYLAVTRPWPNRTTVQWLNGTSWGPAHVAMQEALDRKVWLSLSQASLFDCSGDRHCSSSHAGQPVVATILVGAVKEALFWSMRSNLERAGR